MTNILKDTSISFVQDGANQKQYDDHVQVLLYDINYMKAHKVKHPEQYPETMIDYIEDSRAINEEIKQLVLDHPRIDPRKVHFHTDPYQLIKELSRMRNQVKCILNFCDDYCDREELWSMPVLFDIFKIPFSGYGVKGMQSHNKFYAYTIANQIGIPVPESYYVTTEMGTHRPKISNYPVLVKPNDAGGSEGVSFRSVAHNKVELNTIIDEMLPLYKELIIGEYLPGDELTVALLRRDGEIIPLAIKTIQFINFDADPTIYTSDFKWNESLLGHRKIQVKLFDGDPSIKEQLIKDSLKMFKVFECKDFARIDWKCDADGNPKFLDFNENPMYGADSSFLWCLEQRGLTRRDLFNAMIDNLFQKFDQSD